MKRVINSCIAVLLGVAVMSAVIVLCSENPSVSLAAFFLKPFSTRGYMRALFHKAGLFVCMALGASCALKTGMINLGGDGQIYAAGFVTALLLREYWGVGFLLQWSVALLCALSVAGILACVSGILKAWLATSEMITSFLLSTACVPLIDALIITVTRDPAGNLLATAPVHSHFILQQQTSLFGVPAVLTYASLVALAVGCFFSYTRVGYQFRICGKAPEFGRFVGFPVWATYVWGMVLSGALFGLTGFFSVVGLFGTCYVGFSVGMGYAALAHALIAHAHITVLVPLAFFFAWMETASEAAVLGAHLTVNVVLFLQAAIFLLISAQWSAPWNAVRRGARRVYRFLVTVFCFRGEKHRTRRRHALSVHDTHHRRSRWE